MQKTISFLTSVMIMCAGMPAALAAQPVTVVVNGEKLNTDQGAEILDGRTFLPLRAVSETVGAEVEWSEAENAAIVSKGNVSLMIYIGDDRFYARAGGGNWEEIALDAPARIVNDRTMVPIRAIAEQLGLEVGWDAASYTVTINGGEKTLAAEPLGSENIGYPAPDKSSNKLQSFEHYCDGRLTINGSIKSFTGSAEDMEIIEDYVDLLCSDDMNFTLVDKYEYTYKNTFFSYGLDYTGTARVDGNIQLMFKDDVYCDVCLYGSIERNNLKLTLLVPDSIEIADLGYRYGGGRVDIKPAGASAIAGLSSLGGGVFETSDGRLRTEIGKAMIIRDGEHISADAEYVIKDNKKEYLDVSNFYRSESLCFQVAYNTHITGDLYRLDDLRMKYNSGKPSDFIYPLAFAVRRDNEWEYPLYKNSAYEDLTVRVMYYEKNVAAVFYIYAEFNSSPYEIEALCAVDLSDAYVDPNAPQEYTLNVNESVSIVCPTVFDYSYQLFSWEIIEGGPIVELEGDVAQTCTIKAKSPGRAIVQVTYQYGTTEPDVLTGIPRRVSKTETHQYAINVQ